MLKQIEVVSQKDLNLGLHGITSENAHEYLVNWNGHDYIYSKYYFRRIKAMAMTLHAEAYTFYKGERPKDMVIDHIDNNRFNNDPDNLQTITKIANIAKREEANGGKRHGAGYTYQGIKYSSIRDLAAATGFNVQVMYKMHQRGILAKQLEDNNTIKLFGVKNKTRGLPKEKARTSSFRYIIKSLRYPDWTAQYEQAKDVANRLKITPQKLSLFIKRNRAVHEEFIVIKERINASATA